jgi:uroporphyrin-III C-methyltransferase
MGLPPGARTDRCRVVGSVFLIGSDPEWPGRLCWPALAALGAADAVVHDGTVDPAILALVPQRVSVERAAAAIERVGKLAGEGWRVVWLVNGDPARSRKRRAEALRLREAGVAMQTITGLLPGGEAVAVVPETLTPQLLATPLNGLAG